MSLTLSGGARALLIGALACLPVGCAGGDDDDDDQPRFACKYKEHAFTLCGDGARSSTDTQRCTMVRTEAVCTNLTRSDTTCTSSCCTDRTFSAVTFAQGSC